MKSKVKKNAEVEDRCLCVPVALLGAAQEGSCSPHPSSTTPEMPSTAQQRKDCAMDTKHANTVHHDYIFYMKYCSDTALQ